MDEPHRTDSSDPAADRELSLDDLSRAYAELLGEGGPPPPAPEVADEEEFDDPSVAAGTSPDDEDTGEVTPLGILEAMLFVGHPRNEPLTRAGAAELMRDVTEEEIDELVGQLNDLYDQQKRPYRVVSIGAGYSLQLREEYDDLKQRFRGRIREARLSQAAIDLLAVVAYNQPLTRDRIYRLRGKPSGSILRQLVRRGLLRLERPDHEKPRNALYHTTDRFLDVFGLDSLSDLPRSQDLDRS